jgi:hypothetical protein
LQTSESPWHRSGAFAKPVKYSTACQAFLIVNWQKAFVKLTFGEWNNRGRVELQWLMKPLTGLASRVQYPLATPSRPQLAQKESYA